MVIQLLARQGQMFTSCLSGGFGRPHKITVASDAFHHRPCPAASPREEGNPQDWILGGAVPEPTKAQWTGANAEGVLSPSYPRKSFFRNHGCLSAH